MQTSDLARNVLATLSAEPGVQGEPLPARLLERHPALRDAWLSWRENPERPERATALRVALDEALGRDAELRSWAEAFTVRPSAAAGPAGPALPPHPSAVAPPLPPARPPRTGAAPAAPAPPSGRWRGRPSALAVLLTVLALTAAACVVVLTGALGPHGGHEGHEGLEHHFALGVQGHRRLDADIQVRIGGPAEPRCEQETAGQVFPVTVTVRNAGPVSWRTDDPSGTDPQPSLTMALADAVSHRVLTDRIQVAGDDGSGPPSCTPLEARQGKDLRLAVGQQVTWVVEVPVAQRAAEDDDLMVAFSDVAGGTVSGDLWDFRLDGTHQRSRTSVSPAGGADPAIPGAGSTPPGAANTPPALDAATGLGPAPAWSARPDSTSDRSRPEWMSFSDRFAYPDGPGIRVVDAATGHVTATVPEPSGADGNTLQWQQGYIDGTEVIGFTYRTTVPSDGLTPERHHTVVDTYGLDGTRIGTFTYDDDKGDAQFLNGWIVTTDKAAGTTAIRDPRGRAVVSVPTDASGRDVPNSLGVYDIQAGRWAFVHARTASGDRTLAVHDLAAGGKRLWDLTRTAPAGARLDPDVSPAEWGVVGDHVVLQWQDGPLYAYDVRNGHELGRIGDAETLHLTWDADHDRVYAVEQERAYAYDLRTGRRLWQQGEGQLTFRPETCISGRLYGSVGVPSDSGSTTQDGRPNGLVLDAATQRVLAKEQSFRIQGVSGNGFVAVRFDRPDSQDSGDDVHDVYAVYRAAPSTAGP
ncbi:hypothetical protein LO771_27675 [Streptacidiphilus sp. ASG 303]|uniref:hypothetical protein n=1 Tax=Streptacidiphilus sp. ASG 303 TaxID=2896847 RepID=UPI001E45237D|nr:hypothetical protein [Streptacidiphilus sp. ASG 303]MCD0486064.1 hypothetical protein [Streptacidiphilus sp. ASG 303]